MIVVNISTFCTDCQPHNLCSYLPFFQREREVVVVVVVVVAVAVVVVVVVEGAVGPMQVDIHICKPGELKVAVVVSIAVDPSVVVSIDPAVVVSITVDPAVVVSITVDPAVDPVLERPPVKGP